MPTLWECDSHTTLLEFHEGDTRSQLVQVLGPPMAMNEVMGRVDEVIRLEEQELALSKRATATIAVTKFPNKSLRYKRR